MTWVRRDGAGAIVAVSHAEPQGEEAAVWSSLDADAPELRTYLTALSAGGGEHKTELARSDMDLIRVLEDVIDLLIDRGVIVFTDLPPEAQSKLSKRQSLRAKARQVSLLEDDDDLI